MNADGTVMSSTEAAAFAEERGLPVVDVEEIVRERLRTEQVVSRIASAKLPTTYGEFRIFVYQSPESCEEHVAVLMGEPREGLIVHTQPQCLVGSVFRALNCDCSEVSDRALSRISAEGEGVLVYTAAPPSQRAEARSPPTRWSKRNCEPQDENGRAWHYGLTSQILRDLNLRRLRVLVRHPDDVEWLRAYGVEIADAQEISSNGHAAGREWQPARVLDTIAGLPLKGRWADRDARTGQRQPPDSPPQRAKATAR